MKHLTMPRLALALLSTGLLCVSLAPTASASGGNSASAKQCQKDLWQTLQGSTGPFTSEEQCVSYRAMGGAFFFPTFDLSPVVTSGVHRAVSVLTSLGKLDLGLRPTARSHLP